MMEYADKFNIDLALLFLDYQKAFDSVEWSIIHKNLESFGFGKNLLKWIHCIYNINESCVINNGPHIYLDMLN